MKFFADDTMLYSVVKDPVVTAMDLNHDLDIINKWAYQWTKEAKEVLFPCKKSSPNFEYLNHLKLIKSKKALAHVQLQPAI